MAIDVIVQYNGGFLPDILLLTVAPIFVWLDGTIIVYYYYLFNYILYCFLFCYVWWPCMFFFFFFLTYGAGNSKFFKTEIGWISDFGRTSASQQKIILWDSGD